LTDEPCRLALLIPGLCGPSPEIPATGYPSAGLPALERLLSRARVDAQPLGEVEHTLAGFFSLSGTEGVPLAVAPLTWLADSGVPASSFVMRADPVHLRADQACLRLFDSTTFTVAAQEARELVAAFNEHYRQRDWQLHAPLPQRWYLTLNEAPEITTMAPLQLAGRDIRDALPQGKAGATWHAFLNEVQMLFHEHPVNRARERRGDPVINSIWPWGGGYLPARVATTVTRAFADQPLLQGLARLAGIPCRGVPENAGDLMVDAKGGQQLVLLDRLERHWRYGDPENWASGIARLEQTWFRPLLDMLVQGRISGLDLYPLGVRCYVINRRRLRYFWKPDRSLAWHCRDASCAVR
jgi:hypothetical protein